MVTDDFTIPSGFQVKRAYEAPEPDDGYRVLADRMWPRGVTKEAAHIDEWAKEITPSTELRRWFHEDPEGRRDEFADRYREELAVTASRVTLVRLRGLARTKPPVTLVTAVKDPGRSHIPVLMQALGE
ncbi:DUF488 domain-containing protein [Nocardia sp. CA-290969]|uniref:DUF488 domain-containing protein n=1 Tax=Nocardia sp. CA-290969 TaxID=3239986 RepID=UPI003D902C31